MLNDFGVVALEAGKICLVEIVGLRGNQITLKNKIQKKRIIVMHDGRTSSANYKSSVEVKLRFFRKEFGQPCFFKDLIHDWYYQSCDSLILVIPRTFLLGISDAGGYIFKDGTFNSLRQKNSSLWKWDYGSN